MRSLLRHLLSAFALTSLAACSTTDYRGPAERYLETFQAAHRPTATAITRAGAQIRAREFGREHRGRAATIVLLHGFPDSQHLYDGVAPALAKARHVVTFDFLGWGDSDKPAGHVHDAASLRADLEAVIAGLNLASVVLVAHDLSGQPAIDWALDNEARVEALVLLNTYYSNMASLVPPEAIARFSTPGLWRELSVFGASRADGIWQSGVDEQIRKFFSNANARDTYVPLFVHQALGIRPAFFAHNRILRDEVARRDGMLPRLARFHQPVRIVFGADDPYLNPGVARELQQLFPRSELHLVPGGAHYVQLDQPEAVAALIATAGTR